MEELRVEGELLDGIQRLRKELNVVMKDLDKLEGFRERLQDTRAELMAMYEKLAVVLVKQELCGCECCTAGAHVHADLQVSHSPLHDATHLLTCTKERFDSLQRNLQVAGTSEETLSSSSDAASLGDTCGGLSVGGPQCG